MCVDPITATMAVAAGAQGAMGIGSKLMAGRGTAKAARMQTWMARRNADMALGRGAFEEARVRDRTDQIISDQGASVTARNIDPAYGSPLVMAGLTAMQGEADAMITNASAQQDAASFMWQAAAGVEKERDATRSAYIGAGTELLKTVTAWANLGGGGGGGAPGGGGKPGGGAGGGGFTADNGFTANKPWGLY